jgi:hypothetical protein
VTTPTWCVVSRNSLNNLYALGDNISLDDISDCSNNACGLIPNVLAMSIANDVIVSAYAAPVPRDRKYDLVESYADGEKLPITPSPNPDCNNEPASIKVVGPLAYLNVF